MKKNILIPALLALAFCQNGRAGTSDFDRADCVTLLDSTHVSVTDKGTGTFNIVRRFKVQTMAGAVKNRSLRFDYDPLTAHARFKYAVIFHANGSTDSISPQSACDYPAPARAIYWGAQQIMLGLENLCPGDEVAYEVEKLGFTYALLADGADDLSRFEPPMSGQFYDIVPFWVTEPTRRKVYVLSMPAKKKLNYRFYQGSCRETLSRSADGKRAIYEFSISDAVPFKKEPNMVDLYDVAPKLMLSTTGEWKEKSRWFNRVNESYGSFRATPEARKKVFEILKGKNGEMEKISALAHWVADNIRYAGITMGKGEGYTLHSLKMNVTDRCGVCKDIAGTLIGFLRIAGFKAYPAMTMAGSRVEQIAADHFNHCVCVVYLSNGTLMPIDPTWIPFCRELWSSAEQQQNYLPGIPDGSDLLQTPVSHPENHYFRITAQNRLDADGTLSGRFVLTAEGQSDSRVRSLFTRGWQSEWMRTLEGRLLQVSPKAQMLKVDYGKAPKDYQAAPIRLEFTYLIPDYATPSGDGFLVYKPMVMNNLYRNILTFLNIQDVDRKYAFKDACSRLVELKETLALPRGYRLVSSPRSDSLSSTGGSFSGSLSQDGSELTLSVSLSLPKRVYEAADWEGFRSAVNTYKSYADYLILKK